MTTQCYSPDELLAKFRQLHDAVSTKEFFGQPQHKKTQEMWCAAQFGRAFSSNVHPCLLHVAERDEQTDADFHLEVDDNLYPFQITERLAPGRRRGDEYKNEELKSAMLKDWDSGTHQGPNWVRESIEKKFAHYGGNVSTLNLLVYANFLAYDHDFEKMCSVSSKVAAKFASVWLLNGNAICCISGSGVLGRKGAWLFMPPSE